MRNLAGIAALLVCLTTAWAGEKDHPYKNAKVGDYAIYSEEYEIDQPRTVRKTLIAKENTYLTFRIVTGGDETSYYPEFVNLSDPFPVPGGFDKVEEGNEKVRIAGKVYDARWTSLKLARSGSQPQVDLKVWYSLELSLPLLKSEKVFTFDGTQVTNRVELVEFGHKPDTGNKPE